MGRGQAETAASLAVSWCRRGAPESLCCPVRCALIEAGSYNMGVHLPSGRNVIYLAGPG